LRHQTCEDFIAKAGGRKAAKKISFQKLFCASAELLDNFTGTRHLFGMTSNIFLRSLILIATFILALGLVTPVHAQSVNATTLLDDAYATLAQAKHDYKGHRVHAMKQIEAALGEAGGKVSGKGKVHEPQGTSDAQLRAAAGLLQQAKGGLSGKALKHVDNAIAQINDALAVK
jgi:hypothetical protein